MAHKKKASPASKRKTTTKKPSPKVLGAGMAAKAAKTLKAAKARKKSALKKIMEQM